VKVVGRSFGVKVGKNKMGLGGKVVVGKDFVSLKCIESMSFAGGMVVDENFGIEHHSNG